MITVMGATGNTGGAIAALLLEAGEKVRVVGRSQDRLAALAAAGAEPYAGDVTDASFLAEAFRGADAVYTLLPVDMQTEGYRAAQDRLGEAIVAAAADADVPYLVALSSLGADVPEGTGIIEGLYAQEQRLRTLGGTDVLILRPGSFLENYYGALEVIRHEGVLADSVAPEVEVPMIAVRDIAAVAAGALQARDWSGVEVRELLGERDISHAEIAAVLGAELGMPDLAYVQVPDDDMVAVLAGAGISADAARLLVAMNRAISEGVVVSRQARTAATTTPTSFEVVAAELAAAYRAAA